MTGTDYDVVVVGSGPAGLQAAIHASRRRLNVLVLGRSERSNAFRAQIDNVYGVQDATGADLMVVGRQQAEQAGVGFLEEDAVRLDRQDGRFIIETESGVAMRAKSADTFLLRSAKPRATGSTPRCWPGSPTMCGCG